MILIVNNNGLEGGGGVSIEYFAYGGRGRFN